MWLGQGTPQQNTETQIQPRKRGTYDKGKSHGNEVQKAHLHLKGQQRLRCLSLGPWEA